MKDSRTRKQSFVRTTAVMPSFDYGTEVPYFFYILWSLTS